MKKILFAVSLLIFASCQQKNDASAGVITKDKMQSVLMDMHFAKAKVDIDHLTGDSAKKVELTYYNRIFSIHHISAKQFFDSFDYYTQHPELMDDLYQNIINDLGKNISTTRIKALHKKQ